MRGLPGEDALRGDALRGDPVFGEVGGRIDYYGLLLFVVSSPSYGAFIYSVASFFLTTTPHTWISIKLAARATSYSLF